MKSEDLNTRFGEILAREFASGRSDLRISGSNSLLNLAMLLAFANDPNVQRLPHLVVVAHRADALRFQQILQFLSPNLTVEQLSEFDVSPYSGLEASPRVQAERMRFLSLAQRAGTQSGRAHQWIFVTSIAAVLQKTLPFSVLKEHSLIMRKGSTLPSDLPAFFHRLGFEASPQVEDVGQFSIRGGVVDFFPPAHDLPVRLELFGDEIESLRAFSAVDQSSVGDISEVLLTRCRETLYQIEDIEFLVSSFRESLGDDLAKINASSALKQEFEDLLRTLSKENSFPGRDFCLPFFYKKTVSPLEHFSSDLSLWLVDPMEVSRQADVVLAERKTESTSAATLIRPPLNQLYSTWDQFLKELPGGRHISLSVLETLDFAKDLPSESIEFRTYPVAELSGVLQGLTVGTDSWLGACKQKLSLWLSENYRLVVSAKNRAQAERIKMLFERMEFEVTLAAQDEFLWETWLGSVDHAHPAILVVPRPLPEAQRLPEEKLIFLREQDFFGSSIGGQKTGRRQNQSQAAEDFQKQARRLSFGDLQPGDCIVHVQHGIGVYDGLKIMTIGGADSEFIQISYKDKDKLYLPVYRVGQLQKYAGASATAVLDKLGGPGWEKTKAKVKSQVRDLASDLIKLYAERSQLHRPHFQLNDADFAAFETAFPYDETDDQLTAIGDLVKDLSSERPMDRLICGDVGFGKTEVAMRATYICAKAGKQVAVLAPTTVLSFQHFETFKRRFKGWNLDIRELNRFVTSADVKKNLKELAEGKVDIIIGTHRLLSKDVVFKDLGLLVIDEEQKFGVAHKERIRKLKTSVDTLAMSATPIPRTLNMGLVGIRDLSLINTAPVDRLPTRTFVCRWEDETLRKAMENEIARGGQVYFIHNRIQSIYGLADEIRKLVPNARTAIGHGQMDETELEKVMVSFFNHEIDILICTTIVESGMDVPRANTMIIDQAHMMGLSQLYQLRGRVGRSKDRAYCYLLLPRDRKIDKLAQERLRVIQENTALGSGIRIAQYDLELRGAGNLLGEEQSGHINAVGYELYMDLLNEAVQELRGQEKEDLEIDPEINLRIPALIPEAYIHDIRLRLSYYKALADIRSPEDLDKIEDELKDQFGPIPDATLNLMGLMLIRQECRYLGIKDITAGPKNLSLIFSPVTRMKPETVVRLATKENKKYSITPDNRLNIRMNNITWPNAYEELQLLRKLV